MELKVICLPPQEDPASFLAKNNDLNPFIQQAQDIFHFYIATLGSDFITKSLSQKVHLVRSVLEIIAPLLIRSSKIFYYKKHQMFLMYHPMHLR